MSRSARRVARPSDLQVVAVNDASGPGIGVVTATSLATSVAPLRVVRPQPEGACQAERRDAIRDRVLFAEHVRQLRAAVAQSRGEATINVRSALARRANCTEGVATTVRGAARGRVVCVQRRRRHAMRQEQRQVVEVQQILAEERRKVLVERSLG